MQKEQKLARCIYIYIYVDIFPNQWLPAENEAQNLVDQYRQEKRTTQTVLA